MKTNLVRMAILAVAAVAMAAPALAGQTLAEREMSMEFRGVHAGDEARVEASVPNGSGIRPPIGAGNLPSDEGAPGAGSGPAVDFPWYENLGGGE